MLQQKKGQLCSHNVLFQQLESAKPSIASPSLATLSFKKKPTKKTHSIELAPWLTPPQLNLTPEMKFYSYILNLLIAGDYNEHTDTPLNYSRTAGLA